MTEYQTLREWLFKEPNYEVVVPHIKESIDKKLLNETEIESLRSQVVFIKRNGHAKYCENNPLDALDMVVPEAIKLQGGGCVNRIN
jgi:hypothetical protein